MGWICYDETPFDIKSEIARLCTGSSESGSMRPLYIQRDGSTWYAAVEAKLNDAGKTSNYTVDQAGRYVFAAVFLTSTDHGEWGYKDMDETCGPCMATASPKLINMLSDTTSDYAVEWRAKCLKNARLQSRKLKHGDCIEFKTALSFGENELKSKFRVNIWKPQGRKRARILFDCLETSELCNIRGYKTMDWDFITDPV